MFILFYPQYPHDYPHYFVVLNIQKEKITGTSFLISIENQRFINSNKKFQHKLKKKCSKSLFIKMKCFNFGASIREELF